MSLIEFSRSIAGMSLVIGHVSLPPKGQQRFKVIYSDKLSREIDQVSQCCYVVIFAVVVAVVSAVVVGITSNVLDVAKCCM